MSSLIIHPFLAIVDHPHDVMGYCAAIAQQMSVQSHYFNTVFNHFNSFVSKEYL
jgi:hypothetical protein